MKLVFQPDNYQEKTTYFAEVIVPVPLPGTFTYRIPYDVAAQVQTGVRVVVPFGKRRIVTGIVRNVHRQAPEKYQARYLIDVLDDAPAVTEQQMQFWEWMAAYYMCSIGEVMNAALPAGLKISSESHIQLAPDFAMEWEDNPALIDSDIFGDDERKLLLVLRQQESLRYDEASAMFQEVGISHLLKGMLQKRLVLLYEQAKDRYKPRVVRKVRLTPMYRSNPAQLQKLLAELTRFPQQEHLLLAYLSQVPINAEELRQEEGLLQSSFLKTTQSSESSLHTLVKKGVLENFHEIVSRLSDYDGSHSESIQLSEYQQEVFMKLLQAFNSNQTVLLHGVTGSGKTELYIKLIEEVINQGQQVLLLLPEIALTTQIVSRLSRVFGNQLGVYHSRFSDSERVEVWQGVQTGRFSVIVGVRSSIFLPFQQLGLIIVDEEHDASYKQYDPAPRYNTRDMALVLAQHHAAKVLLGSATPSIESYYLAAERKYGFVKATQRYKDVALPEIRFVNIAHARKQKTMQGDFAPELLEAIGDFLAKREQIILFQNRRGYAPHLSCDSCSWVPQCNNCAVSLTFHLQQNELRCHYCGYRERAPSHCRKCASPQLRTVGFGTEKIEDELKPLFPNAVIERMDLDTTRARHAYQQIIENFARHQTDILVGTQMVTKGLDFERVNLVGVFDIDRALHFPDFRAHERVFQLLTQVSGRAGRHSGKGLVLIQTANPAHPVLELVQAHQYEQLYQREITQRQLHQYPPFCRLVKITVKGEELSAVLEAAKQLAALMANAIGKERVLGPEAPLVARIRNLHLLDILIKIDRQRMNPAQVKKLISECSQQLAAGRKYKKLLVVPDVDPLY